MKKYSILNISGHEKLSPSMPRNSCYGQKLDYFSSAIAACVWKYYNITNDTPLIFNFRYHLLYHKKGL